LGQRLKAVVVSSQSKFLGIFEDKKKKKNKKMLQLCSTFRPQLLLPCQFRFTNGVLIP
jgi:hypothetical protein